MKYFLKVFFISLICFSLIMMAGIFVYSSIFDSNSDVKVEKEVDGNTKDNEKNDNKDYETPIERAMKSSDRLNILMLGLENKKTDTIMVASFDKKTKQIDVISIPRDTYFQRKEFDYTANNKINILYEVKGIEGIKSEIETITKMPIHNYVTIDYEGLEACVDAVGGVEVDIPITMDYDDIYSDPPLHIHFKPGKQLLDGENAMKFLRFRKNNDQTTGYANGDLGRIEQQQNFIKSAIKKAMSFKLVKVIADVYPYVKTDISLTQASSLVLDVIGISADNINFYTIEGNAKTVNGISFYIYDEEKMVELLYKLYGVS